MIIVSTITSEYYNLSMPWNQAYRFCENKGGHLVTISNENENNVVYDLCTGSAGLIWIGATDFSSESNWYWITGEPFAYKNWNQGEPNNTGGAENYAMMYIDNSTATNIKKWNDTSIIAAYSFVCEYDNGDVDADSYVPSATVVIDDITYEVFDVCVDWQTAEAICKAKGGTLVTVDSSEKNEIISQIMAKGGKPEYWINVTDKFSEGVWTDSEGDPISYTNWIDGDPNNNFNCEQYVAIRKDSKKWLDIKGFSPVYRNTGFICEYHVPTNIALDKTEITLKNGSSQHLKAIVVPSDTNKTVTWSSSNTKVASVDNDGNVTAVGSGYTIITAETVNHLKAECTVKVTATVKYLLGDANKDGRLNIRDVTSIQRTIAEMNVGLFSEIYADVNLDNTITISDATLLQRFLAEMIVYEPINQEFSTEDDSFTLSDWSEWTETAPVGDDIVQVESRTEYRYKDTRIIESTSQPTPPNGYSLMSSNKTGTYTSWSAWSGWSTTRQSADGVLKQEGTTTGYRYYAFVCPNCGQRDPYNIPSDNGNCSNCGYKASMPFQVIYYEAIGANAPSNTYYDQYRNYAIINGQRWYYEKPGTDNGAGGTGQPTATMYRYCTRSEYVKYVYQQNEFGAWQLDKVVPSDTREVETRTVYRYKHVVW